MTLEKTGYLGAFFSASMLSISTAHGAPPLPDVPQPPPFNQITDDVLIVSDKVDDVSKILTEEQQQLNDIESKVDLVQNGIRVQVSVNELLCQYPLATGACVDTYGHIIGEPATSGNHNPIRVVVTLTRGDGFPLLETPQTAPLQWQYTTGTGVALGTAICGSAQDLTLGCRDNDAGVTPVNGPATYAFDVHPAVPGANWQPGGGTFTVKVTDAQGYVGVGLGEIVIPVGE